MKHGKFEVRKPNNQIGSGAYSLYKDNIPLTNLCFGSEEAAFNYFKKYMEIPKPDMFHMEPAMPVKDDVRTVGNYSNSGYLALMDKL
jgi:hypothetical protein